MTTIAAAEVDERTRLPAGLSPLLSRDQLAAYYGVSEWTVRQWVKDGCPYEGLPNGRWRFDLDAVKAWIAERNAAKS